MTRSVSALISAEAASLAAFSSGSFSGVRSRRSASASWISAEVKLASRDWSTVRMCSGFSRRWAWFLFLTASAAIFDVGVPPAFSAFSAIRAL